MEPGRANPQRVLWGLTATLGALAALGATLLRHTPASLQWPPALAVALVATTAFLAETHIARLHHGNQVYAWMWTEISLTIGLFTLPPTAHLGILAGCVLSGTAWRLRATRDRNGVKLAFGVALSSLKLMTAAACVRAIGGPPSTSTRTLAGLVLGMLAAEVLGNASVTLVFRIVGQRPTFQEWFRGAWFALAMAEVLTTATFGIIVLGSINHVFVVCGLSAPLGVVFGGPWLARVIEQRNEWARHGRFIDTVERPDSSLAELVELLRVQLCVARVDMVARLDPASQVLHRCWIDHDGYHETVLDLVPGADALWDEHHRRPTQTVAHLKALDALYLDVAGDALVVTIGTGDGISVWAAAGYEGRGGRTFPKTLHEVFGSMCWAVHNKLDARRRLAEANRRITHDSTTGLPNRDGFRAVLDCSLPAAHDGTSPPVTVALIDLDDFKTVNDTWGHHVGDDFLLHVARAINASVPSGTVVARLSGDEFAVLLTEPSATEVDAILERVTACIALPYTPAVGSLYRGSGSIGYATYPSASTPLEPGELVPVGFSSVMMRHADAAMFAAKKSKGTGALGYEPDRDNAAEQTEQLAADVTNALASGALTIHLQPIFAAATLFRPGVDRVVVGLEALARIEHPAGMIMPGEFIRVAERTKQIHAVTERVLELSCAQLAAWDRFDVTISVNLSVANLADLNIVDKIRDCIERHAIDPRRLVVEVTESMTMLDQLDAVAVLEAIRRLGVRVSMDDFGTGHSSLSRLTELPVDELKIDRSFVVDATREVAADDAAALDRLDRARTILRNMVTLARELRIPSTVEGIETEDGVALVQSLGADKIQGYVASRPLRAGDATALLAEAARPRVAIAAARAAAAATAG